MRFHGSRRFSRQSRRGFSIQLLTLILGLVAAVSAAMYAGIKAYQEYKEPRKIDQLTKENEKLKDENRNLQAEVEKWRAAARTAKDELGVQMAHEKTLSDYLPNKPISKTVRDLIKERDSLLLQDSSLRDGIDRNATVLHDLLRQRMDAAVDPAKAAREK